MTESSRHDFFEDRAGQLRSRVSSMLEKMATWHIHSVAPFVTLLRAGVRQGAGRGPSSVMVLPRAIAQSRLYTRRYDSCEPQRLDS